MDYDILKFSNGCLELEVNVSPNEETVFLNQEQLSLLYETSKQAISYHINNILKDGELGPSTIKKILTVQNEGGRLIKRNVAYYDLDMIISIGYRVNTKRGIVFRKWANSVLKEYLIKGYALNQERAIITKENYLGLLCRVDSMEYRITKIEEKEKHLFVEDKMFLDGEMFDAIIVITRLIETAKKNIVLIDPYTDVRTLDLLKYKNRDIPLTIIMSGLSRLQSADIEIFELKYGPIQTRIDSRYHDRYLVIDDEVFYHVGTSINYMGNRVTQVTAIQDKDIQNLLRERIKEII